MLEMQSAQDTQLFLDKLASTGEFYQKKHVYGDAIFSLENRYYGLRDVISKNYVSGVNGSYFIMGAFSNGYNVDSRIQI